MSVDWDEETQERTEELHRQIDEGILASAQQTQQINQVLSSCPEVFADVPGVTRGVVHHIPTPPGMVVQTHSRPIPLTLLNTIE